MITNSPSIRDEIWLITIYDPHPLLGECRREFPAANHVQHRIVDQVIVEQFPQVRHGSYDDGGAGPLILYITQDQAAAPIDKEYNDYRRGEDQQGRDAGEHSKRSLYLNIQKTKK